MMTLEQAIQHCEDQAARCSGECATEHLQLSRWLRELKENRNSGLSKFIAWLDSDCFDCVYDSVESAADMRREIQAVIHRCRMDQSA